MNKLFAMLAVAAALCMSADSLRAQDNGGGGGGRRGGGGFGGGGNFDPAAMQQRRLDRAREQLGFTNDTDWNAVQPLVQKVMDAQRDTMTGRFGGFRRNRGGGGDNGGGGGGGGFQPPSNPDRDALQEAVDSNAPAAQIKAALDKYRTSEKAKQTKLQQAQADLLKVLNQKQEASAVLLGLLE